MLAMRRMLFAAGLWCPRLELAPMAELLLAGDPGNPLCCFQPRLVQDNSWHIPPTHAGSHFPDDLFSHKTWHGLLKGWTYKPGKSMFFCEKNEIRKAGHNRKYWGGWGRKPWEKGCGDIQDTASQNSFPGLETLSKQCINKNRKGTEMWKWVNRDSLQLTSDSFPYPLHFAN